MEGIVLKSTGSWYEVRTGPGQVLNCRLRGKFKLQEMRITNPVAVGDRVIVEQGREKEWIITEILQRTNYVIRKSTKKEGYGHILASNIDQAILVVTFSFPRTSLGFIDRFLVSTESFRIPARIIFNKADLMDKKITDMHRRTAEVYERLGYETMLISALNDNDLDQLQDWINRKISLISGHSGVGKSTILNRLSPDLDLVTREVSTFANKGTHATTFASMYELGKDTFVIDTPGIKELGMIDMEDWEISHYFPEMRDQLGNCRYNNCLHINEPGCRVLELLNRDLIAESRYKSYLGMVYEKDNRR